MVDAVRLRTLLVALAGWVNRHQLEVIAYLREENRVLHRATPSPRGRAVNQFVAEPLVILLPVVMLDGSLGRRRNAVRFQDAGNRRSAHVMPNDGTLNATDFGWISPQKITGANRNDTRQMSLGPFGRQYSRNCSAFSRDMDAPVERMRVSLISRR